jgi:hypothetical protein
MSNEERALFQRLVFAVEALVRVEAESLRLLCVIAEKDLAVQKAEAATGDLYADPSARWPAR